MRPKINTAHPATRARLALACTALLALLAIPSAAEAAKAPRAFYGVTPQSQLGPADYTRMGQGKVGLLRHGLVWAFADPTEAPLDYNWGAFDQVVAGAAANGIKVLPVIYATPTWVTNIDGCSSENCFAQPPRSQRTYEHWKTFLRAAVNRYGPNGLFWTLNPALPKVPVTDWQIWNEQNSPSFWQPRPNPAEYGKLLSQATRAIKGIDPGARVVLGGMFYSPLGGQGSAMLADQYLRKLYRIGGIEDEFDGVALHPYAQAIRSVKAQIVLSRRVIRDAGDDGIGLWITEIGWASNADKDPLTVGIDGQAKKLKQAFRYFTKNRRKYNIQTVSWFSWRNIRSFPGSCEWCPRSGLFTRGGFNPKPAWRRFTEFTGGS